MGDPDDAPPDVPAGRAGVERARAHLMGGHGPGASPTDIARHTRGRTDLAGQPTAQRRAQLARQTALARGDTDALAAQITATSSDLGATLAAIKQRIVPVGRTAGRSTLVAMTGFALGPGMTGVLLLVRRLRGAMLETCG